MRAPPSGRPGEIVIVNAAIHVTPGAYPTAPAMAITDGRILVVGAADDARAALPAARVVDLAGRTVLPAFADSHSHFHRAAILRRLYLDFESLAPTSVADVLSAVRERAQALPAGAWIQGDSITAARLAEERLPLRHELDAVAPRHRVILRGIGKHVVAANSAALADAGIDRDTPDPPGGRIERDAAGEPTGILHERAKLRLDTSAPDTVVPAPTEAQRLGALRAGIGDLHALGVSLIHEMVRLPAEAADWAALHERDHPLLRVRLFYRVHESPLSLDWLASLGIRSGWGDGWLAVAGVKISVDGWCIFGNAAVHQPYRDEGGLGIMRIEPAELQRLVAAADAAGLRVAVHAVGARAVDAALAAFEAARPLASGPHRIEHAHIDLDEDHLRRMGALGLVLSAQPGFLRPYLPDWQLHLEADRVERIMPLATAARSGIPMLLNSDVPSGPLGPLLAIDAAVHRTGGAGRPRSSEALGLVAAWRAHSSAVGPLSGEPDWGSLAAGHRADAIVLDDDPFASGIIPPAIGATIVGGRVVHDPGGWLA